MAEASSAGISPRDFWDLTYRELFAVFKGRNIAAMRAHKLSVFEAWHGAAFQRARRLPVLGDVLRKLEPPRVMSPRQMRKAIFQAAAALGANVRTVEKTRR